MEPLKVSRSNRVIFSAMIWRISRSSWSCQYTSVIGDVSRLERCSLEKALQGAKRSLTLPLGLVVMHLLERREVCQR